MDYQVEEVSPVQRKITVTVPAEEVNAAITATAALYRRNTDVKGFRKGKVPSTVIESKFKKQIIGEATQDLINYQLNEIMAELGISPLGGLEVDAGELARDEAFSYTFGFEMAPEFELPEYKGLTVQVERPEVDENEVEKVVERVRKNVAKLVDITEDRSPVDGEVAIVDFAALGDDKGFEGLRSNNFQLPLGEGQALPAFEDAVKTMKKGETRQVQLDFPADFINEDLAGKSVDVRIVLKELKSRDLPTDDDELATRAGFGDANNFRDAIRASYMSSREALNRSTAQKKLLDQLMEGLDFPLPDSLVERNVDNLVAQMEERLDRQGKSFKALGQSPEEIRAEQLPRAQEMARSQLFLLAVASAENLTVAPQEVDQEIARMAQQTGQDMEMLKRYYDQSGISIYLKDRLLADKAMELIYNAATIEHVEPEAAEGAQSADTSADTSEDKPEDAGQE